MGKSGAGKQPRVDALTRKFGMKQLSTGNIFRHYLGLFEALGPRGPLDQFRDEADGAFLPDDEIKRALGVADRADADDVTLGLKAAYFVNQGRFVPDEITNALFAAAFEAMDYRGAVLDGFPRTEEQARFLKTLADQNGARLDAVLLVENEDEAIIARALGRRICETCGGVYHMEHRPPPEPGGCDEMAPDCRIVQRGDDTVESLKARLREFQEKTKPAIAYLAALGVPVHRVSGNLPDYGAKAVEASVFAAMGVE